MLDYIQSRKLSNLDASESLYSMTTDDRKKSFKNRSKSYVFGGSMVKKSKKGKKLAQVPIQKVNSVKPEAKETTNLDNSVENIQKQLNREIQKREALEKKFNKLLDRLDIQLDD